MSWIPVEERLPEVGEAYSYLVTRANGVVNAAALTLKPGFCYLMTGGEITDAIAWMPYPAPYVKPRRFVVGRIGESSMSDYLYKRVVSAGYYVLDNDNSDRPCSDRIPTREAAEKIADIYEEAYRGE